MGITTTSEQQMYNIASTFIGQQGKLRTYGRRDMVVSGGCDLPAVIAKKAQSRDLVFGLKKRESNLRNKSYSIWERVSVHFKS
jgi:hypothetical protein